MAVLGGLCVATPLHAQPADPAAGILWLATRDAEHGSPTAQLASNSTWALRVVIVLALVLLLWRPRKLIALGRRVRSDEWLTLGLWTAGGAALRLIGGVGIPGFTSAGGYAHGYGLLRDVLVFDPLSHDPHGDGWHALHGLIVAVLPAQEITITAAQLAMSVATIPLTYAVARSWLGKRSWASAAAAVMAILPTGIYFGTTEVRLVPGTFFLLCTLGTCALAIRTGRATYLFAAALLGAVTVHLYPTLLVLPWVILGFVWSHPRGRALIEMRGRWWALLLFGALWIGPAASSLWLIATEPSGVFGRDFLRVFSHLPTLLAPSLTLSAQELHNVFLQAELTPPPVALLGIAGVVVGLRSRAHRFAVGWVLGCALLFTLVGLFPGRLNLARLQLPAGPFYAMLAGIGLSELGRAVARRFSRPLLRLELLTAAVVLWGSLALWPGPIGKRYTLQLERAVFAQGLSALRDGCAVIWGPSSHGTVHDVPLYLAEQAGQTLRWGALAPGASVPPELLHEGRCLFYYRLSLCFTVLPDESRAAALRPECARLEAQLELEETFVRPVPARPDDMLEYARPAFPLGFYQVRAIGSVPPPPAP